MLLAHDVHPDAAGTTKLIVAKNRSGGGGVVDLVFRKEFTRFESASKIAPEDIPTRSR